MEHVLQLSSQKPQQELQLIKHYLNTNQAIIPIEAELHLTKGQPGFSRGYFLRDFELEKQVDCWLEERIDYKKLLSRYQQRYPELYSAEKPAHYAIRCYDLNGKVAQGENIFMFFPSVLGINSSDIKDYFGFEFVDMWTMVFDQIIFPCVKKVFDIESQLKLYENLRPVLEKAIYLASIFHEIGHRCGAWRVSPHIHKGIKINAFHTDVLGELSTDMMLCHFLKEFPEIKYFIFLQRLFWFGRFGFEQDPIYGKLNIDNDTWISTLLWNRYINNNVLTINTDSTWKINFSQLEEVYTNLLEDIDELGNNIKLLSFGQDDQIHDWMNDNVESNNGSFYYPESMRRVFEKCLGISETIKCQ